MNSFKVLAIACLVVAKVHSSPVPQTQPQIDLFSGFLRNSQLAIPSKEADVVKRRIFEDNPDRELKQISFQHLIGDLEQSLFSSAASAQHVAKHQDDVDSKVKPQDSNDQEHINKRSASTESEQSVDAVTPKVLLQTTQKVAETKEKAAHILIDRIAIQPPSGVVALIPTFQIQHKPSDGHEITKISITRTEISAVPNTSSTSTETPATSTAVTESSVSSTTKASSEANVSATTKSSAEANVSSTTVKNIEDLKEAEVELKEKVAEIEAEPVILSARV